MKPQKVVGYALEILVVLGDNKLAIDVYFFVELKQYVKLLLTGEKKSIRAHVVVEKVPSPSSTLTSSS